MSSGTNIEISADEQLSVAYEPFPSFESWLARNIINTEMWERAESSFAELKDVKPLVLERAREMATRAAALDTGAIENLYEVESGFTFTVACETGAWQAALDEKGERVRSLFEAQLHAYNFVLDLATTRQPVSEAAIRELHKEVCKSQDSYFVVTPVGKQEQTLNKGEYKKQPNHVRTRRGGLHAYAPVEETAPEMARLVSELRSELFLNAPPTLQAAYVHYAYIAIHPFADGNGRVARALASTYTYRAYSIPVVILLEHKPTYLRSLERADQGDYQAFGDFMSQRILDTMRLVRESVSSASKLNLLDAVGLLEELILTRGGYKQEDVDQSGAEFLQLLKESIEGVLARQTFPRVQVVLTFMSAQTLAAFTNYRTSAGKPRSLLFRLTGEFAVTAISERVFTLYLPHDAGSDDEVILAADYKLSFSAPIRDILPTLAGTLRIRTQMFAEGLVGTMIQELVNRANQQLNRQRR